MRCLTIGENLLTSIAFESRGVGVVPSVGDVLAGDEYHALAELEVFIGKQVKVKPEPLYIQEQFDVVMM